MTKGRVCSGLSLVDQDSSLGKCPKEAGSPFTDMAGLGRSQLRLVHHPRASGANPGPPLQAGLVRLRRSSFEQLP